MCSSQHVLSDNIVMLRQATLDRLALYLKLIRFDRPIGTLLLLWPTLWALWIASSGHPHLGNLIVFTVGTFLMRSAGCAINDYADRDFDAHVKRTAERPLAAGRISPSEALWVATVLALAAFAMVLLTQNRLTIGLSFGGAFLAASYPFTKRFFAMPQAYLGVAFGFGIPMAFAAETGAVPAIAWILLAANVFWTIAYDTEYAIVDRDDDIKIGIKTTALLFGRYDVAAVMACYAAALLLLAVVAVRLPVGAPVWIGLAGAACIAGYHYSLIRSRQREQCFKAFLHNNWWGLAIFCGFAAGYVWP
jgi:4-hydroxybenzoate polyprenyltransferase